MTSIQINPLVFSALVAIIVGIIGYFYKNKNSSSDSTELKLTETVSKLDKSITRLDTTIQGMKDLNTSYNEGCKERHERIDAEIKMLRAKTGT